MLPQEFSAKKTFYELVIERNERSNVRPHVWLHGVWIGIYTRFDSIWKVERSVMPQLYAFHFLTFCCVIYRFVAVICVPTECSS